MGLQGIQQISVMNKIMSETVPLGLQFQSQKWIALHPVVSDFCHIFESPVASGIVFSLNFISYIDSFFTFSVYKEHLLNAYLYAMPNFNTVMSFRSFNPLSNSYEVGSVIIPIFLTWKLRHREVR